MLCLIAALTFFTSAHADIESQLQEPVTERCAELDELVPALLQIQKDVNQKDKYFKNKTKKDAGPILNARISWAGTGENAANKKAYAQYLVSLGEETPKS